MSRPRPSRPRARHTIDRHSHLSVWKEGSGLVVLEAASKVKGRTRSVRAPGRGWEIIPPGGALFLWPYDPYDPYNPYSEDRKSPPGMYVALLKVSLDDERWRTVRLK